MKGLDRTTSIGPRRVMTFTRQSSYSELVGSFEDKPDAENELDCWS